VYFLRACPTSGSLLVDHRATSDGVYETGGVQPFAHGLPRRAVAAIAVQYLEKIFQVVLTLPSLASSGYVSLVDSLINPQAEANRTGLVRDGGQQLLDTALEALRDVPNKVLISADAVGRDSFPAQVPFRPEAAGPRGHPGRPFGRRRLAPHPAASTRTQSGHDVHPWPRRSAAPSVKIDDRIKDRTERSRSAASSPSPDRRIVSR
jgi:hypothetical protein